MLANDGGRNLLPKNLQNDRSTRCGLLVIIITTITITLTITIAVIFIFIIIIFIFILKSIVVAIVSVVTICSFSQRRIIITRVPMSEFGQKTLVQVHQCFPQALARQLVSHVACVQVLLN